MKRYIRLVCCTAGLACIVVISAMDALFMKPNAWFDGLEGMAINEQCHSLHWLFVYGGLAVLFGAFLFDRENRKICFLPLLVALLGTVWCFLFFRLNDFPLALACFCVLLVLCGTVFVKSIKYKTVGFVAVGVMAWYLYLFSVLVFIFWKNRC